jgi:hypothetical protein
VIQTKSFIDTKHYRSDFFQKQFDYALVGTCHSPLDLDNSASILSHAQAAAIEDGRVAIDEHSLDSGKDQSLVGTGRI